MSVYKLMSCMGDSLTSHRAGQTRAALTWPTVLAALLQQRHGIPAQENNMGIPGDTSAQMLARADEVFRRGTPALHVIWAGQNDGTGVQANYQALIKSAKYRALGAAAGGPATQGVLLATVSVASVAALPALGAPGQRYVVLSDSDATGGQPADPLLTASGEQLPTVTGVLAAAQTVWEYRSPLAGNLGWGRVATAATSPFYATGALAGQPIGCPRVVSIAAHYQVQQDTPSTPGATLNTLRAAQAAAVAAENVLDSNGQPTVILADLFTWMLDMIIGGTIYGTTFTAGTLPNNSADASRVARTPLNPAQSPQITQQIGTLSAGMLTTGLTSIPTTAAITSGAPIVLGFGTANQEGVWATGNSTGTTVACTPTANTHASADEVSVPNLHINEYGNWITAQCVAAAIESQAPNWIAALAS